MLTKNFYSCLCGGGKGYSSTDYHKVIKLDKSSTYVSDGIGGLSTVLSNSVVAKTNTQGYEVFDWWYRNYYNYTFLRLCYFDDNKNLTDAQIYTPAGDTGFGEQVTEVRTVKNDISNNITGFKIVASVVNRTTKPVTFNTIKIIDRTDTSSSYSYDNSTNIVLACIQLDSPITINPDETYNLEYSVDNVFEDIPDTIV